ncbi:MAG: T9SS type A sorting domain-containing protein, partial [Bacteroidales bacterium]|nr:T9SS type A sorting domain-containing protein [Bacteroidales bacterium]
YGVSDEERKKIIEENLSKGMLTNEEYFKNSDYILEVVWIPYAVTVQPDFYVPFEDLTEDNIYTTWVLKVLNVYKGNNVQIGDTVLANSKGGVVSKKYKEIDPANPDTEIFREELKGSYPGPMKDQGIYIETFKRTIIFGRDTEIKLYRNSRFIEMEIQNKQRARIMNMDGVIYGLNGLSFPSIEELYNYMRQFKGLSVPPPRIKQSKEQNDSIKNYILELEEQLRQSSKKKALNNDSKVNVDITFKTSDHQQTFNSIENKHYLEFDVSVSVNSSNIYLFYVAPRIKYNTVAFGQNIKDNGKLTVTNFINTKYNVISADFDIDMLGISYLYVNSGGMTLLSSTPTKILHIKIELLPGLNNVSAQIQFFNDGSPAMYCTTANGTTHPSFNNIYFNNPAFTVNTMLPTITSFTPTNRHAGLGEEITINGTNFGTQKGKVLFTSAEAPTTTNAGFLKGLDKEQNITNWTDNEIKVKVPSFVQDGYISFSPNIITQSGFGGSAGTGPIKVVRADSVTSAASSTTLTVEYSLLNYKENYNTNTPIERTYLIRNNCEYDFRFHLHINIRDHADKVQIIAAIEAVLAKWREITGLNIIIAKNANNTDYEYKSIFTTSYNIIGFGTISSNLDAEMGTSGSFVRNNGKILRAQGASHIRINPNEHWCYYTNPLNLVPSGQVGFYNALLHEVGHILLLGHIKNEGKLMHCGEAINAINPIINLTNQSSAINAVNKTILDSKNITWNNLMKLADSIPKPVITSNDANLNICNYPSIILSTQAVSGASYLWKKNGVNYAATQSITVTTTGEYKVEVTKGCTRVSDPVTIAGLDTPIISSNTGSFHICNTASITLTTQATGASYLWKRNGVDYATTQSITITTSGAYTVRVTKDGCIKSSSNANVSTAGLVEPVITSNTGNFTVCNDLFLLLSTQEFPYVTYQWQRNGINFTNSWPVTPTTYVYDAGQYTVQVSRNGCTIVSEPVTVVAENFAAPTITSGTGNFFVCDNTPSVTLSIPPVSGATYQWMKSGTDIPNSNSYSITVSDIGFFYIVKITTHCMFISNSAHLVFFPYPIITASDTVVCNASPITLTVNNIPTATSYLWSNGATGQTISVSSSGNYTVTVSNGLCEETSEMITISNPLPLTLGISVIETGGKPCTATAIVSGGIQPYSYQWKRIQCNLANKESITVVSTTNRANISCGNCNDGYYKLTVTDACGTSVETTIPCCTPAKSIQQNENSDFSQEVEIYPNPTTGTFQISNIKLAEIQIFTMLGVLLKQQKNITENSEINLENLLNGVYFVKIIEEESITNLRLIIEK